MFDSRKSTAPYQILVPKVCFFVNPLQPSQGADFKNNKTTKQESHQKYISFLGEQFHFDQQEESKVLILPS